MRRRRVVVVRPGVGPRRARCVRRARHSSRRQHVTLDGTRDGEGSSICCAKAKGRNRSHRCTPVRGALGWPRRDMGTASDACLESRVLQLSSRRSRAHAPADVAWRRRREARCWPLDCSRRRARSPASPVVDGRASDGQDRCGFCAPARCGSVAGCRFELVVKRCAKSRMFTLRHVPMGERGALDAFTPSAWAFDMSTAARDEVTTLDCRRAQAGCHVPMASSAPCREPSRPASRGRSVYDRPVQNARPEHRDISGEGVPDRAFSAGARLPSRGENCSMMSAVRSTLRLGSVNG